MCKPNLRTLFLSTIILNEPSPSIRPDHIPGFTLIELEVENFFKSNCLDGFLIKEFQPFSMLKPGLVTLFLSKSFSVHLKFIKCDLINQLPSTRCSFTTIFFSIADLDPRLSILFSPEKFLFFQPSLLFNNSKQKVILRLVTLPE